MDQFDPINEERGRAGFKLPECFIWLYDSWSDNIKRNDIEHRTAGFFYYSFLIANTILIYLIFIFAVFFISSLIYQFHIPIRPVAYIIVLGSGLIDGIKVPPLLAGRIDRALKVYRKQAKHPPILVMSGGQGGDEKVPESHAMRDYALACGINADHIIVENQSKNTYENLLFSKRVIEEREKDTRRLRILFSTTNYHVYRAGIYASKVKLKANGIGAPTRFYFWLNALVREYVAILVMNKKKHVICLGMLLILAIVCGIIMREEQNVLNLIRMIYQYVQ